MKRSRDSIEPSLSLRTPAAVSLRAHHRLAQLLQSNRLNSVYGNLQAFLFQHGTSDGKGTGNDDCAAYASGGDSTGLPVETAGLASCRTNLLCCALAFFSH